MKRLRLDESVVRVAQLSEHKAIMKVAKQTKWTRDFGNQVMFSSPAHYERGWILVAEEAGEVVGFSCIREKVRSPEVVLYFVGIDANYQNQGWGWRLIEVIMSRARHRRMTLKCAKDNPQAKAFYDKHEFVVWSEDEKYWTMTRMFR